jgi:hypothetical protein
MVLSEVRIMAKGKDEKGGSRTKPQKKTAASSKKTKKAKKALDRAKKSVEAAQKAVKASTKKLRKKVASLSRQSKQLSADHAKAVKNVETAEKKSATASQPPRPADGAKTTPAEPTLVVTTAAPARAKSTPAPSAKENGSLTPPLPKPQPASATLVELRQQAKDKKVPGYYRMNKSDLIAALESAQRK